MGQCRVSLGGSRDDLRAPVVCVGAAKPSVLRVKGLWQPQGAVVAEALLQAEGPCLGDHRGDAQQWLVKGPLAPLVGAKSDFKTTE